MIDPIITKPLHIGIDATIWSSEPRGHSLYAMRLCSELTSLLPNARFTAYSQNPIPLPDDSRRWNKVVGHARSLPPVLWGKWILSGLCKRDRIDLFWSPYSFLPRLAPGVRSLVTIYDFTNKISPSSFSATHRLAHWLYSTQDALRADSILTISQGTKQQIHDRFGRDALVIPPAVDGIFSPAPKDILDRVLAKYSIQGPYLLNVATWEPRKNIATLIKAFLSLKKEGKLPLHTLLLSGKPGRASEEIAHLVANAGPHIQALGYVPREDLPSLYTGADAFVFPSLYEGYGMPVAEALACGTRVVTTDSVELREAGGARCIYVQPTEAGVKSGIEFACLQTTPPIDWVPPRTWSASGAILAKEMARLV